MNELAPIIELAMTLFQGVMVLAAVILGFLCGRKLLRKAGLGESTGPASAWDRVQASEREWGPIHKSFSRQQYKKSGGRNFGAGYPRK
ncbi:hypothetical protein DB345_17355 [Spartobacteria bacterium LR76]|nr:hypothetical protein DB345_17355 [Spartobacteria bacterium LR76]